MGGGSGLSRYVYVVDGVDVSPYDTLLQTLSKKAKIMVDDNVRSFITQGLLSAGASVSPQSSTIAAIRETKSPAEVAILKAVSLTL